MPTAQRFHFIDNLRCLALLLGVVFHAALAYGPYFKNIWIGVDTTAHHATFDYLSLWLHLFRMPLFFIIAGFCSVLLIEKRNANGFMVNRLKRVLLPFLVFFPLAGIAYFHALTWGSSVTNTVPPILTLLAEMEPRVSTMHLWFLWYLIQFCLVLWLVHKSDKLFDKLLNIVVHPVFLLLALPFLVFVSLSTQAVPFPAPDKLTPALWTYGFYGVLFLVGAGLYQNKHRIIRSNRFIAPLSLVAIASLIVYLVIIPNPPTLEMVKQAAADGQFIPSGSAHYIQAAVQAVAIVSWTGFVFVLGYRFLDHANTASKLISDASYWIYLVHVPVLLYIQLPLTNVAISPFLKFLISVVVTLVIGLASYSLLVRNTWLGVFLNGRKHNTQTQLSESAIAHKS
ncbi:acyltransferase family protein [Pseudoalteromonas sp. T1lg65]|uniref:acyltransferase family protein n=1 Tax=Pseudoalteromonas sp. T1lg65 TaxID=2077101 RepID=UPI003F7979C5